MRICIPIWILLFSALQPLSAQDSICFLAITEVPLEISAKKGSDSQIEHFDSKSERNRYLNEFMYDYYEKGFLTASWSTIFNRNDTLSILVEKGKSISWVKLKTTNVDPYFLDNSGYRRKDFDNKIFRYDELASVMIKLLQFSEDHGYPFAEVLLDSIIWTDSSITADLILHKNQFILFDTIEIIGNLNLSGNYLRQYTGIHSGEPYDQDLLDGLDNRLKEIPFANVKANTKIEFYGNTAKIIVYLDEKKTSRFDFIVGVIPNTEITGRFIVTGEGRLDLHNIFNAGEIFKLHFSKLESTTKELQTYFGYPYLPCLPLGLETDFNLFLKDSNFLELSSSAGVLYQFGGSNNIKAFVSFYSSSILTVDTNFILSTKTLPPNLDLSERAYGLTWNYEQLNYKFNPRNGYAFSLTGSAGTKNIEENNTVTSLYDPEFPDFDFGSLYDSVDTRSLSFKYKYDLRFYIPFFKRNTLLLQAHGSSIINSSILQNELLRLGGNSGLRGFDDQSIPVSQFHILTGELRYLLSQNSYASIFADAGYVENRGLGISTNDFPFGIGAGVNFETKAGIFGLNYALGSQNNNPLSIKNAKIHFGYVNYF